jgi:hypothetical protein
VLPLRADVGARGALSAPVRRLLFLQPGIVVVIPIAPTPRVIFGGLGGQNAGGTGLLLVLQQAPSPVIALVIVLVLALVLASSGAGPAGTDGSCTESLFLSSVATRTASLLS